MSETERHLERWRQAGLIDEGTAARIRTFESAQQRAEEQDERPGIMEALVYLGVAVVVVGVVILVGSNWEDLRDWARVATLLVPGVLAIAAGAAFKSFDEPGLVRGGHVAWLAATVLLAGAVAVTGAIADWDELDIAAAATLTAAVLALVFWTLAPSTPQVVGVIASLFAVAMALGSRPDDNMLVYQGLLALAFGALALAAAELRYFGPYWSATALAALLFSWGALFPGFQETWAEVLTFAGAGALIALSISRGSMVYMILGVGLGFAGLVRLIAVHVDDPTMASLALMVVGVLLIAVVLAITKVKPWRTGGATA